ncbi:MAG: flagellar protein FliS [Pirellula sp.]
MIDPEAFLRQEVESASPAKLRWLLLQKAHGLCFVIRDQWTKGQASESRQWVIRIQDILTELLEGIVDPKHELAKQQSDLYVFLSKLIVLADQTQDVQTLDSFREIIEIEKETWEMLTRREVAASAHPLAVNTDTSDFSFSIEA